MGTRRMIRSKVSNPNTTRKHPLYMPILYTPVYCRCTVVVRVDLHRRRLLVYSSKTYASGAVERSYDVDLPGYVNGLQLYIVVIQFGVYTCMMPLCSYTGMHTAVSLPLSNTHKCGENCDFEASNQWRAHHYHARSESASGTLN